MKRWHINFRYRGITQKKAYNIQNMAKVWNKVMLLLDTNSCKDKALPAGAMLWWRNPSPVCHFLHCFHCTLSGRHHKNICIEMLVYSLSLWNKFVLNNPHMLGVGDRKQSDCTLHRNRLFWPSLGVGMMDSSTEKTSQSFL